MVARRLAMTDALDAISKGLRSERPGRDPSAAGSGAGRPRARRRGLAFGPVEEGQTVRGKLMGLTQLASGRFAMIDNGLGFSLVP